VNCQKLFFSIKLNVFIQIYHPNKCGAEDLSRKVFSTRIKSGKITIKGEKN
jgi:hypothetical protein